MSAKSELWWKLNDEMEQLCQELRRYTVFRLLPDDCYDAFFSVIREITGQFSLFPPEEHSLSEDDQWTKLLSASAEEFLQSFFFRGGILYHFVRNAGQLGDFRRDRPLRVYKGIEAFHTSPPRRRTAPIP